MAFDLPVTPYNVNSISIGKYTANFWMCVPICLRRRPGKIYEERIENEKNKIKRLANDRKAMFIPTQSRCRKND